MSPIHREHRGVEDTLWAIHPRTVRRELDIRSHTVQVNLQNLLHSVTRRSQKTHCDDLSMHQPYRHRRERYRFGRFLSSLLLLRTPPKFLYISESRPHSTALTPSLSPINPTKLIYPGPELGQHQLRAYPLLESHSFESRHSTAIVRTMSSSQFSFSRRLWPW